MNRSTKYLIAISAVIVLLSLVLLERNLALTSTLRGLVTSLARMFKVQQLFEQRFRTQVLDTSNWKTYRNEQYGFEFRYPSDWTVKDLARNITISPPMKDQPDINISISSVMNAGERLSLNCPITTHEIECKNLENPNGVNYTRSISTGQLELDKQQQLNGFLASSKTNLQMTVILTDAGGNPNQFSSQTVKVFDQILSTFKFIPSTGSTSSPQAGSGQAPPTTKSVPEGQFCGGIAALPCQEGYWCKLDGIYPDAGGKCVKIESR